MTYRTEPLGEIATIEREGIDPGNIQAGARYVGLEHIDSTGALQNVSVANGELASTKFSFTSDHILFGKLRPYLRKIARPEFNGICSTDIIPIRPSAKVDRGYLFHFLRQDEIVNKAASLATGINLPRLSPRILEAFDVPLPPLDEQRRIAAILDQADDLRRKRRDALSMLGRLQLSLIFDLLGDHGLPAIGIKNNGRPLSPGWRSAKLTDVARLATGHTPDRKIDRYWNGTIPWLTLGDIRALDCSVAHTTAEMITEDGIQNSSAVLLPTGTVCFSRTASVGFSAVMGRPMATSQDFVNWVCGSELNPIYLMWALRVSRPSLLSLATGSTHRTIYFPTVEEFRVLLPPISLQDAFAEKILQTETLKVHHRAHLAKLDALFASLQHRAFRGDL